MGLCFKDAANSSHAGSLTRDKGKWETAGMGYSEFPREALKYWLGSCKATGMKVGMLKT
jgi:hypothetical protein